MGVYILGGVLERVRACGDEERTGTCGGCAHGCARVGLLRRNYGADWGMGWWGGAGHVGTCLV